MSRCRRHHLLAAPSLLRKKAGVSAEGPSLPLLSPASPSSSLPVLTSAISCNDQRNHHQSMSRDSFLETYIIEQQRGREVAFPRRGPAYVPYILTLVLSLIHI